MSIMIRGVGPVSARVDGYSVRLGLAEPPTEVEAALLERSPTWESPATDVEVHVDVDASPPHIELSAESDRNLVNAVKWLLTEGVEQEFEKLARQRAAAAGQLKSDIIGIFEKAGVPTSYP